MAKSIEELGDIAKRVRRDIVTMITAAKSGHPGGSLSAVEILVELYFNTMRIDPAKPKWADRDRFVLSKGHAAPVLYSVMAERGYSDTPKDKLNTLRTFGSVFQGHPDMRFIPSLEASTGSLGQGLSLGLDMALGAWRGSGDRGLQPDSARWIGQGHHGNFASQGPGCFVHGKQSEVPWCGAHAG